MDALGTDVNGYKSNDRAVPAGTGHEPSAFANGVVTPHASFLALRFEPHDSMANLRSLAERFPIYGPYGFLDSVDTTSGEVADCVLTLDQGIIMAAIANALADNALQHAFSDGQIEAAIRPLMAPEEFTAGSARSAGTRRGEGIRNRR